MVPATSDRSEHRRCVMRDRAVRWLIVLFAVAGCGGEGLPSPEVLDDEPGHGDHGDDLAGEAVEEVPPRPLTAAELERYHAAQVAWWECARQEGLALPDPPSLEEFIADGGGWWVGFDLSEDEWNRLVDDEAGEQLPAGVVCGEPPGDYEFRVEEDAVRRFHAFQLDLIDCLAEEGFPIDTDAPTEEEFVAAGGRGWDGWSEFAARYDVTDELHERLDAHCGSSITDLPLNVHSFEEDPAVLERRYEEWLSLHACLTAAGFDLPEPPDRDTYLAGTVGTRWDVWIDAYGRNDRAELSVFADLLEQGCPAGS
jgi:hypothetical protein